MRFATIMWGYFMRIVTLKNRSLLYVLAVSLFLALCLLIFFYLRQTSRVKTTKGWVNHTLQVLTNSEKILRLTTQEAMSHRGYILTNDSAYLRPSIEAKSQLREVSNDLNNQVRDNPRQLDRLKQVLTLIQLRIAYSDSLNRIKTLNPELTTKLLENGAGAALMDKIEESVYEFQLNEYRLLQSRQSTDQAANDKQNTILLLLLIALFIFVILFFLVLIIYVRSQDRLVQEGAYINALIKRISDAVMLLDGNFIITDWNEGAEKIYGVKASDAIGKPIQELITLTKSSFPETGFQTLRETGQWNGEIHKISTTGEEKFLLAAISLIKNTRQSAVGCVAVMKDITAQKRKENQLTETNQSLEQLLQEQLVQTRDANRQLKLLNARLERTREEERKRISRELHDDLGQMLTGAKLHLSFINEELNVQNAEMQEMLHNLLDILDKSIQSVRTLSMELRPGLVEDMGLFKAIDFHAKRFTSQTQIPVNIQNDVEELEVDPSLSVHVFRIFQEALNNVSKHAQATQVTVTISMEEKFLTMQIADNGKGFDLSSKDRSTLGLTSMRERSEILHGHCLIESKPGNGTVVHIKMPLSEEE